MSTSVYNKVASDGVAATCSGHQFQMTRWPHKSLTGAAMSVHDNACLSELALGAAKVHGETYCVLTNPLSTVWKRSMSKGAVCTAVWIRLHRLPSNHNLLCIDSILHATARKIVGASPQLRCTSPWIQAQGGPEPVACQARPAEYANLMHWAMASGETVSALELCRVVHDLQNLVPKLLVTRLTTMPAPTRVETKGANE